MRVLLVLTEQHLDLLVADKPRFESLRLGGMYCATENLWSP